MTPFVFGKKIIFSKVANYIFSTSYYKIQPLWDLKALLSHKRIFYQCIERIGIFLKFLVIFIVADDILQSSSILLCF